MMNFTKEYIELCMNEKIQGLRPTTSHGDWFYGEKRCPQVTKLNGTKFSGCIWLPLSHQLDEEIIKICKEKGYTYFNYYAYCDDYDFVGEITNPNELTTNYLKEVNTNPLIAKIKLLLQLLEGSNDNKE
jgi:hypothetical protein